MPRVQEVGVASVRVEDLQHSSTMCHVEVRGVKGGGRMHCVLPVHVGREQGVCLCMCVCLTRMEPSPKPAANMFPSGLHLTTNTSAGLSVMVMLAFKRSLDFDLTV